MSSTSRIATGCPDATLYVPSVRDGSSSASYARVTSRTSVMSRLGLRSPTSTVPRPVSSARAIWAAQEPTANRSSRPGPSCWKARVTTTSEPARANWPAASSAAALDAA